MMCAAILRGDVVARVARRVPAALIRGIVIATGAVMSVLFPTA